MNSKDVGEDGEGIASLLYVSGSRLSLPAEAQEIDAIIRVSLARNSGLSVTGALVFTERNFAQYLEGPPRSLNVLMDSIRRDRRHEHVDVVDEGERHARRFPIWAMAYAGPSTFVAAHVRSIVEVPPGPKRHKAADRLVGLMRQFVEAQILERLRQEGDC